MLGMQQALFPPNVSQISDSGQPSKPNAGHGTCMEHGENIDVVAELPWLAYYHCTASSNGSTSPCKYSTWDTKFMF